MTTHYIHPRVSHLASVGLFGLALSLVAACDMFKTRDSTQVLWALQTGDIHAQPVDKPVRVVRVRTVGAPSPISGAPLVYRYPQGEIRTDQYNSWISPVQVLATSALESALRSTGQYAGVLSPTDAGDVFADLQVSFADVSAHYELGTDKAFARVSAVVTWMGGEEQDAVMRQVVVTKDVPIRTDSAQGVVESINMAWTQVVQEVIDRAPAK
ncbi:MAG: ABC-type transport auxiliary lipoprotein family protein [Planctomycetota bacterium]|nr:ABC-type transport auxiliary lipoprotein family protein [Planctomycetota bacterium]MDA1106565.1 ABC-type transport auxiliary lipoprotein family protein [Planctomycetota bacterium]